MEDFLEDIAAKVEINPDEIEIVNDVVIHIAMHAIRHSDHVHVMLLSRERLHGDIWRWILSLPPLFTLACSLTLPNPCSEVAQQSVQMWMGIKFTFLFLFFVAFILG